MITIGIDIAKFEHCACAINHDTGEFVVEPFFFKNNIEGFSKLKSSLCSIKSALIGIEDSGHYGDNLIFFLLKNNFKIALINPKTTMERRKGKLKSVKTDKQDAILITKVLLDKKDYRIMTKENYALRQLKHLTRRVHDMKKDLNVYKNRLQKEIDLVFPEFNSLFKTKYGIIYNRILKELSSAFVISNTDIRSIRKIFNMKIQGNKISLTAEELKAAATRSVGEHNGASEYQIKYLISVIELIKEQCIELKKIIEEYSLQLNSPIVTIPGISHFSGMSILSEFRDINLFPTASQLISYAGVNPYVSESGIYKSPHTSITKHGNPYLRRVLYQVILPVIHNNPTFLSYYNLKRSQGKSHRCANGHAVRKLLRIIHHLVTKDVDFNSKLLV
ncbi:IS110 family transposase [Erysipelothrix sp. HDW6A]|uniref:IS110 family transposase n=1 Tax=Erysipelothrix sp. HDW6A TaxID=2714928 RepID=UPI0014090BEC|nr:IS110 family transposase [Erysipelothrix sp. HDW6A]QIK58207.1 IS110 family transposase [Erysipelothrix sp. HDW6A]